MGPCKVIGNVPSRLLVDTQFIRNFEYQNVMVSAVELTIYTDAKLELEFWCSCMCQLNGQPLWPKPSAVRVVHSDASDMDYGGYAVEHGGHVAMKQWVEWEVRQSLFWHELRAGKLILESMCAHLENERIPWFTDNQNKKISWQTISVYLH